jgi:hypothetical protein
VRLVTRLVASLITRLVTRLIAPLVVDYSASRRLVVDYFAYAARLSASARRAARHDYLSCSNTSSTSSVPHTAATSSSVHITSTIHLD